MMHNDRKETKEMKERRNIFEEQITVLLEAAHGEAISLGDIIKHVSGRGQAALLTLFSLPFCQPIQIPGLSTPFGVFLAFIGLRIAFGQRVWLPQWVLSKQVPYKVMMGVSKVAVEVTKKLRFITSTRYSWIVQNHFLHIAHGITIFLLSILLALPLPIPLTNLLAAYPIAAFGLAILEDDGCMVIIAYVLAVICFTVFLMLVFLGKEGMHALFTKS